MKNLNYILNRALPLVLVSAFSLTMLFSGCRDEVGCTNRTSDNYNPDAVRDDGSCINARDKFLGIYSILHISWQDSFPNHVNSAPRYMTVAEDELREAEDDIKIYNFGTDSVTIRALVNKNYIRIPQQNLNSGGLAVKYVGEGHIDDTGHLTILYNAFLLANGQKICDDCVIFADRIDN
jgi:hypothetical protein